MKNFSFTVQDDVLKLGVKIATARISDLNNTADNQEFEQYKRLILEEIKVKLANKEYDDDDVLAGFRDLHTKVGRSNRKFVASPEGLRWSLLKRDRFPHINTLVDIYNLTSVKTGLALGAHDIEKIVGNIILRLTNGSETFIPLGSSQPEAVFPGEYGYVDDGNNVVCRLEVLQVEPTKVTTETKDVFVIIQGNENTSVDFVRTAATEVCELIVKYCGGQFVLLN